jgi:hypothetical protein
MAIYRYTQTIKIPAQGVLILEIKGTMVVSFILTLSLNIVSSTPRHGSELTTLVMISTGCTCSYVVLIQLPYDHDDDGPWDRYIDWLVLVYGD